MTLFPGEKVYDASNFGELLGDGRQVFAGGELRLLSRTPRVASGCPSFATPFEAVFPVVPRGEWSSRLKEQLATKSRVSDFQNFPPHDQDGLPTCHAADTEVLTDKGFVPWSEYNGSDLLATVDPVFGRLEFQSPQKRLILEYDGEMIYSTNRRVDFGVTPDHRMLVRKWDERRRKLSNDYTFQLAGELGWYVGLMHAPSGFIGTELRRVAIDGDREYEGDDFLGLLALVCSDGYAGGTDNTKSWVSFCCFREEKRPRIAALAQRLGFHEQPSRRGVWIRYDAWALADWMRSNCYSGGLGALNKRVPEIVKCVSRRQILHFLDCFGDRLHSRQEEQYYSGSPRLANDLQELLLRVSRRATLLSESIDGGDLPDGRRFDGSTTRYRLCVSRTDRLCLDRKKHLEQDRYRGLVYCATVPNGTLVTRRRGTVLISGNCWANGPAHAATTVRVMQGLPYVELSACSVAVPISGGRVGGNEDAAVEYAAKHGWCSVATWPNNSCDRSLLNDAKCNADRQHHFALEWVYLGNEFENYASAALYGLPMAVAYNDWSHVVCLCDLVEISSGKFGLRIRNNWGKWGAANEYGFYGYATFAEGQRPHGCPDSGFALRQVTPSEV